MTYLENLQKFPTPFDDTHLIVKKHSNVLIIKGDIRNDIIEYVNKSAIWKNHTITKDMLIYEFNELYDTINTRSKIFPTKEYEFNSINPPNYIITYYQGYTILINKSDIIYNTNIIENVKLPLSDDLYWDIDYKNTIIQDIELFCINYDYLSSYSDTNEDYNQKLINLYSNRIDKAVVRKMDNSVYKKII